MNEQPLEQNGDMVSINLDKLNEKIYKTNFLVSLDKEPRDLFR